jgi:hypothetical protein
MGCDVSSQTVRPDISDQSNLDNHALNARHAEKTLASSVSGDAQNNDTQSTHGAANDVSNMLSRPDNDNTGVAHEGNDDRTPSIESHLTDSTGLLYCDVASIINPQNMIAAIKRGDTDAVKALCNGTVGHAASGINSLGMDTFSKCNVSVRLIKVSNAYVRLTSSALQYQECGILHHS